MKCTICKYGCEKAITMKKHMNTKHDQASYKCNEFNEEFQSNDALAVHISKEHEKDHSDKQEYSVLGKQAKHVPDMKDCPLCEDSFLTDEEFNIHINEHLTEIKSMNIEYLKNGHEIFVCNICSFESNNTEQIKNHLAKHTLSPKAKTKPMSKSQYEALCKSKNWQDAYDDEGNPLYETTDSEDSSDNE